MLGFQILRVTGRSMEPVIPQHSFILVATCLNFFRVQQGQRLLIAHPELGWIVKTVAAVDKYGFIWSRGENKASMSIEQIGPVSKTQIIGRIVHIFQPSHYSLQ